MPLKFATTLFLLLSTVFTIHLGILYFLELPFFENQIVLAYAINLILAAIIFLVLHQYRVKFQNTLGFLFMGGSFLKFIVFFLVFYPAYKEDGKIQGVEFAAFFIPYLVALIFETVQASKMLNGLQNPKD